MEKKKILKRIMLTIFLSIFLFFSFFDFIQKTNYINTGTVLEHLKDIGKETANNYHLQFDELTTIIQNVSNVIGHLDMNEDEIGALLTTVKKENSLFKRIWYVDKQRNINNFNDDIEYNASKIYTNEIFKGKTGITDPFISGYDGTSVIVAYSPVYEGDVIVGGVAGIIEMNSEFHDYIYDDVFHNESYAFVTSVDGYIISKIKNENILYLGDNFFNFLSQDVEYIKGNYNQVLKNVKEGKAGFMTYRYQSEERLVYYTPIQINGWYIFNVISNDVVTNLNSQMNETTVYLIIKITIIFAIALFYIVRYFIRVNKRQKNTNNELMTSKKKIEMILKQTSDRIFEYDIHTDSLILDAWNDYPKIVLNHFLTNIHNYNFVVREHEKLLKEKFNEMINTKKSMSFDAKLPYISKDEETWFHISMTYVNENNRLIGTLRNSTKEMQEYNLLLQDQMFKNSVYSHSFFMFAVNLKSSKVVIYQQKGVYYNVIDVQYNEFLSEFMTFVHEEDIERVEKFFSYDQIKNIYHNNGKNIIEFRLWNKSIEEYEWFRYRIQFERQSSNNELLMIAYSNDINDEKSQQLEYEYRAKRDGLTDIYNRQTFHQLVNDYLKERKSIYDYCAYIILDLDNFKLVNDSLGHSVGDYVIKEVATIIDNISYKNGYAGRYGGDEFVMFLFAQESYAAIEDKVRDILHQINNIELNSSLEISASIGIKFVKNETDYQELFDKCDEALYVSKNSGKNRYYVYFDENDENTVL